MERREPPESRNTKVTYHKDVRPILERRCTNCHKKGGIGPFTLDSYDKAFALRSAIKNAVQSRRMPPWHAGKDCQQYHGNVTLSDLQIQTIVDWVDGKAPEGDAADFKPLPEDKQQRGLSRVDLSVKLPVAYVPKQKPDDYRCFIVDWPKKEKIFVTGYAVKPGNPKILHHVIAYLVEPKDVKAYAAIDAKDPGPGYTCFGGPGGPRTSWLGGWAPGGSNSDFPDGLGLEVKPGSKIVLQMHYNVLSDNPKPDQTTLDFKLEKSVKRPAAIIPFTNTMWTRHGSKLMHIPAGKKDVEHKFAFNIGAFTSKDLVIYTANLHMHQLGKSAQLEIERADGSKDCILKIPRWDFNWQRSYALTKPLHYKRGDKLSLRCTWDNTAANQPTINGKKSKPRDVYWGEGTGDEMCLGVMMVTYAQD